MNKRNVALLYGGRGHEHEVSKMSATYLCSIIDEKRYIPHPIFIDKAGGWYYGEDRAKPVTLSPTAARLSVGGEEIAVDVVFPMLHGDIGEDGTVSGALLCLGIPYVGCHTGAGALAADKALTKAVARSLGIPVARDMLVLRSHDIEWAAREAEASIGYPMFIKPTDLGSSVGARAARDGRELREALKEALSLSPRVLIEELVEDKRELECAYLGTRGGELISPPGEVILDGTYDYERKYLKGGARCVTRAELPDEVIGLAREYTRRLVHHIGIRQIARVDYFLTPAGLILNEINTMPGFTGSSLYPKMVEGMGICPEDLVTELIEGALVL